MKRSALNYVAFLSVIVLIQGCAFGTRHVPLSYPPSQSSSLGEKTAHAATISANQQPIVLLKFADDRQKTEIGEVRNGWGMKTADVVSEKDVAKWVTDALAFELMAAGYQVSQDTAPEDGKTNLIISGQVLTVYCAAHLSYEGDVSFYAKVEQDGKELIRKRYSGEASAGLNWAATSSSYGSSLSQALQRAAGDFVRDVRALEFRAEAQTQSSN